MMNRIMANLRKFGKIKNLHTIISKETIKPSSSTPLHLNTHNLSRIDHLAPNIHMPLVFFYQNYTNGDINILKKSLSHSLTQYYPFAGRLLAPAPVATHIDCDDEGVEFVEASIDSRIDDFILKEDQDETFDQLIPNALGCAVDKTSTNMVAVQLSHFTCGGVAVAVVISHKVADAFTMANFINHWATLTRGGSPINPSFFSPSMSMSTFKVPEASVVETTKIVKYAIKRFVFPNTKLNKLKKKINRMGTSPVNATRVESLTSLLFKCALGATITKSGSLQLSSLVQLVNLRGKTNANFPELAPGNFYAAVVEKIKHSCQIELNEVIINLRRERMELQQVKNEEEIYKKGIKSWMMSMDDQIQTYVFSSICRFPFYQVDFGWGKPARVMLRMGHSLTSFLVFMDTPSGDGIEATVRIKEEEMSIFQKDKELHAYTRDI
ncbi:hypothetical protein SSX86_028861 [Deinandra increscens subsp. villosa]|uniref:Uncharacterized protein n=1 Tax=Deinandra increscens subsp. villosa TaxID=3103831 RepID=A0AAP0CBJ0_9ASTR